MNYYIFAGKIINPLTLIRIKSKLCIYMTLIIPNNKRGLRWYKVVLIAKSQMAKNIFQMYQKGDSIIVEGCIYTKKYKANKFVFLKVNDIHPTSNILNNFI